jgi:K+-sensing histidine kinase KdpD
VPEPSPDWPRLLALAAHELRTPVNVVMGYLRMLREGQAGTLADAQRALIDAADRSTLRLVDLLGELAELANLESGDILDRQPVALADLVSGLSPRGAPPEAPTLPLLEPVPEVTIEADRPRLRTALATIAWAGQRRDEPAADLALRAWVDAERDALDVSIALGPRAILAEVGAGARVTWHAFDAWRSGYGLALVLAARVIALHAGAVWTLATHPGRSATLVCLPTSAGRAA